MSNEVTTTKTLIITEEDYSLPEALDEIQRLTKELATVNKLLTNIDGAGIVDVIPFRQILVSKTMIQCNVVKGVALLHSIEFGSFRGSCTKFGYGLL